MKKTLFFFSFLWLILPILSFCRPVLAYEEPLPPSQVTSFFGQITPPPPFQDVPGQYGGFKTGLIKFGNNILKLLIAAAGLFAFFNIVIAGYTFLSAGGDPKKIEQAWARIWQSLLGLLFVAGSFVLAAIFGWLIFGDAGAILAPKIYGP
ncbi:MAG TPA: hypothetical protein VMW25_01960 [Clostridia bacterium]|nr:hypothetical protein [Clostridia bacterium]